MEIKKPTEFLCQKCIKKMREYDKLRRRNWLEVREVNKQVSGKVKINKLST